MACKPSPCKPFYGEVCACKTEFSFGSCNLSEPKCVPHDGGFVMDVYMWLMEVMIGVKYDVTIDAENGFDLPLWRTDWLESPPPGSTFHCMIPDEFLLTYDAVTGAGIHVTGVQELDSGPGGVIYAGEGVLFYEPASLKRPSGWASLFARGTGGPVRLEEDKVFLTDGAGEVNGQVILDAKWRDEVAITAALAAGASVSCSGPGVVKMMPYTWRLTLHNVTKQSPWLPWCNPALEGSSIDVDYAGYDPEGNGFEWQYEDSHDCVSHFECEILPNGHPLWAGMVVLWVDAWIPVGAPPEEQTHIQECMCMLDFAIHQLPSPFDCLEGGRIPGIACSCYTHSSYVDVTGVR